MTRKTNYGETVQFRVPVGVHEAIARAAAKELTVPSEWLRRTIVRKLQHMGVLDGQEHGATGL